MNDPIILLQTGISGLLFGSVYGLIAFGLTLVFALTRLLNFAHGSFMLLAMYGSMALSQRFGIDPYLSVLIHVPVFFGIGYLLYRWIFAGLMESELIVVVQLTLGFVFIIQSALQLTFTADPQTVRTFATNSRLAFGDIVIRTPLIIALVTAAVLAAALFWMLQRTDFGRFIRASVQDPVAAALMGIDVNRVRILAFSIAIALLGIAGPLAIPMWVLEPAAGMEITLFGFIVVVLGGMGSFVGAFVGGLIVGVAEAYGNFFLPGTLAPVVPYALFILMLLFRPSGLFGEA